MLHRFFTLVLAGVLIQALGVGAVCAQTNSDVQAVEQVKSKVARLGVGEKARATVRMKDGRKLKGYIAQARETDFVLRDRATDAPTEIAYSDVNKVESNRGHSLARNLALGIGIGAGLVVLLVAAVIARAD
jgi:preprotein translocase subunit SecF